MPLVRTFRRIPYMADRVRKSLHGNRGRDRPARSHATVRRSADAEATDRRLDRAPVFHVKHSARIQRLQAVRGCLDLARNGFRLALDLVDHSDQVLLEQINCLARGGDIGRLARAEAAGTRSSDCSGQAACAASGCPAMGRRVGDRRKSTAASHEADIRLNAG